MIQKKIYKSIDFKNLPKIDFATLYPINEQGQIGYAKDVRLCFKQINVVKDRLSLRVFKRLNLNCSFWKKQYLIKTFVKIIHK